MNLLFKYLNLPELINKKIKLPELIKTLISKT
jgi:hypothetical protein